MLAPIVLFVYNRPEHTQKTLQALINNDLAMSSVLYVFCDGARSNASKKQLEQIEQTRVIVSSDKVKNGFSKLIVKEQEQNLGLAESIVGGVSEVIEKYGKVIVLEDDIVTSKGFLKFMNDSLNMYQHKKKVMHVSGYMFPADLSDTTPEETFFYRSTSCWGWATWQRAWEKLNLDTHYLLSELQSKKQIQAFDLDGAYLFSKQLELNISKKIKTWAVKWYASVFLSGGLCLHPKKSLVQNIGTDNSGDNSPKTNHFWHKQLAEFVEVKPIVIQENEQVVRQMKAYYKKFKLSFVQKIINRIRRLKSV